MNKIDQISIEELDLIYKVPHAGMSGDRAALIFIVPISANHGWNFDELLEKMWEYLDLVRVYTKPRGVQPDFDDPVVLRKSHCSVEDFCNTIVSLVCSVPSNSNSIKILSRISSTLLYGENQYDIILVCLCYDETNALERVGLTHILEDEDVISIVKK